MSAKLSVRARDLCFGSVAHLRRVRKNNDTNKILPPRCMISETEFPAGTMISGLVLGDTACNAVFVVTR